MSESPQGLDGISLNNGPVEWINKHVNPDYFVPNPLRSYHYLTLDRSVTTFHPNFSIPIGNTDSMLYQGKDIGGVNDRPISSYQNSLFPEEYHHDKNEESQIKGWTAEYMLRDENRLPQPKIIHGGFEGAFKEGKVVLDIGSGQAVGLMQLALRYPNTVFVGLDILYKESRKIYTSRRGLQLTHGDWRELKTIPDKSIDTILSLQGIGMWGLPGSPNFDATNEDGIRIVNSLTRIAKSGCVLRMDFLYGQELEFLRQNMPSNGWELENKHRLIIARKL